MYLMYLWIE